MKKNYSGDSLRRAALHGVAFAKTPPNWIDTVFTTKINEGKYYWNGDIEEDGIFFSGKSKSEFAAESDGHGENL